MKVIFMGTPSFAVPILRAIYETSHDVIAVVTQPDRPRGRGRKLGVSPVKELAMDLRLFVMQPETTKDEGFIGEVNRLSPDVIVVAAYGRILTRDLLNIPPLGCINVHASLLPKYRGPAPIQWAIINGERRTGITIIKMDEGIDTGDILLVQEVEVGDEDTAQSLHDTLREVGARLIITALDQLNKGILRPIPQDHRNATHAPFFRKEDGLIDWGQDARDIRNRIRGFTPWPGAYTYFKGLQLKIFNAEIISEASSGEAGTAVQSGMEEVKVTTGKDSLLIKEVQLEGRKRMSIREFLIGNKIPVGTQLG
jgi:methionyl-tRNA formyltransferase